MYVCWTSTTHKVSRHDAYPFVVATPLTLDLLAVWTRASDQKRHALYGCVPMYTQRYIYIYIDILFFSLVSFLQTLRSSSSIFSTQILLRLNVEQNVRARTLRRARSAMRLGASLCISFWMIRNVLVVHTVRRSRKNIYTIQCKWCKTCDR